MDKKELNLSNNDEQRGDTSSNKLLEKDVTVGLAPAQSQRKNDEEDDDDSAYETDQTERRLASQKLKKESKKQQKSVLDGLDVEKSR